MATQRQSRFATSLRSARKLRPCTAKMRQISERAHVTIRKTRLRILLMSPDGAISHNYDTRAVGPASGPAAACFSGRRAGPGGPAPARGPALQSPLEGDYGV